MAAVGAGRIAPLGCTDDATAYSERYVRLVRVESFAGHFLAVSLEEGIVGGEEYDSVAREYATQALTIRRELAAWRDANPDPEGRW